MGSSLAAAPEAGTRSPAAGLTLQLRRSCRSSAAQEEGWVIDNRTAAVGPGVGRPARRLRILLLLALLASVLALLGPGVLGLLQTGFGSALQRPECVVETPEGDIGLDRDQAKLVATAAVLLSRGLPAPATPGIDASVVRQLADGPPDDAGPGLSCAGSVDSDLQEEQLTATGLTPRAERVRAAMAEVFGDQSLGGFAPGGVGQGHGAESTHYDGRAIDVFFRPVSEENRREGWLLAQWLVAHAADLDVQYVIFDDRFWSAHIARGRWHHYDAPAPADEILRHVDHVHADVLKGTPG